ncbi:hypothetical protein ACHQM5_023916 [Ranunculus cassubicifolius]
MGIQARPLHIFFFPLMAHGHTIPMVDIARLFAARGTKSTIITTHSNSLHFAGAIERDRKAGLDIQVQIIRFPSVEAGLPKGVENVNSITSPEMVMNFLRGVNMLQEPFEKLLEEHRPDCVVADMFLIWTTEISKKYQIPRLVFHGMNYFSPVVDGNLKKFAPHLNVKSDSEIFVVPDLPDRIEMSRSQMPDSKTQIPEILDKIQETELESFGVLVNSFYDMEPAYAEYYRNQLGRRAWEVGPVSLYNRSLLDKTQRGKKSTIDENYCLKWLDTKEKGSVLYLSFGTISRFGKPQLREIANGLEAANVSFIWVVRLLKDDEESNFLPQGFEERMEGKGLVIKEWAPQVLILDHPAVGGFMTHCGWNSAVEGICAGLPLITWPLSAEQFNNENFVTQLLKIGIKAGNDVWKLWVEPEDVLVRSDRIEEVVTELMGNGKEAQERRSRARKLAEMAKKAVEEGGSSYNNITNLIEELKAHSQSVNQANKQVQVQVQVPGPALAF